MSYSSLQTSRLKTQDVASSRIFTISKATTQSLLSNTENSLLRVLLAAALPLSRPGNPGAPGRPGKPLIPSSPAGPGIPGFPGSPWAPVRQIQKNKEKTLTRIYAERLIQLTTPVATDLLSS